MNHKIETVTGKESEYWKEYQRRSLEKFIHNMGHGEFKRRLKMVEELADKLEWERKTNG